MCCVLVCFLSPSLTVSPPESWLGHTVGLDVLTHMRVKCVVVLLEFVV